MLKWVLGCLLLCGIASSPAYADTISGCGTCGGVVYTLTFAADGSLSGGNWYDFTLKVDTTGITASGAQVLTAVALKAPGATGAKLLSYPSTGGWTIVPGGTSQSGGATGGGGCQMNTSNGYDCAQATATSTGTGTGLGVPTGAGDIYTFVFAFQLPGAGSGDLVTGMSLKALYDTNSGSYGGLQTSGTFAAPVPEPGALTLLAAGFLLVGALLKRR